MKKRGRIPILAIIIAGGKGTGLQSPTLTMPKPVVSLADRPFLRGCRRLVGGDSGIHA